MTMESSRRAHRLITEMLELLRELSYETQRQEEIIEELRAALAAKAAGATAPPAKAAGAAASS